MREGGKGGWGERERERKKDEENLEIGILLKFTLFF